MNRQPYTYGGAAPKLKPEKKPRNRRIAKRPPEKQPRRVPELKRSLDDVFRRMVALAVRIACAVMLLGFYVRSEWRARQIELTRSEVQRKLDEQKEVSDTLQVELNRKQDLEHTRDLAISCYGLVRLEPGQVIYYDRAERDYVRQCEEIPKETKSGKWDNEL